MITKRTDLPDYKGYKNFMIYNVAEGCRYHSIWYCGYAVLPEDHILYDRQTEFNDIINTIDVHGGVTYMKDHVIGFDCNHFGDDIVKCNEEYVINEIHKMIDQLEDMR